MNIIITILSVFIAGISYADGFKCRSYNHPLEVAVYNHTHPTAGTRVGAVMILSNREIGSGRQSIALFRHSSGTLSSQGARYEGRVDRRVKELNRTGERLMGTSLGALRKVIVAVDFRYGERLPEGSKRPGRIILSKRNGQIIEDRLVCVRYLKSR